MSKIIMPKALKETMDRITECDARNVEELERRLAAHLDRHVNRLHEHIEDIKRQLAGQKTLRGPNTKKLRQP